MVKSKKKQAPEYQVLLLEHIKFFKAAQEDVGGNGKNKVVLNQIGI